ncbi:MAG: hypothetical protein FJ013_05640 [Chloroflexi bacterium]|nr:hypothetical protein [Chloroflexota bacterium]
MTFIQAEVTETLGWWREPSRWWDGEPIRLLLRVAAIHKSPCVYELCKSGKSWSLSRNLD